MNILKLLKDCPAGTKLYTPLAGEVKLVETRGSDFPDFSIRVDKITEDGATVHMTFNKEGKYLGYPEEECMLFPSKDLRDWTRFEQTKYKPGDFVYYRTSPGFDWYCIYKGIEEDKICTYVSYDPEDRILYSPELHTGNGNLCDLEDIENSRLASNEEKTKIYKALAREGFKWDSEHLKLIPIPPKSFEPFDRVLVRDTDSDHWKAGIFSHINGSQDYPYVTTDTAWAKCIPYEGNEHLIGTTDNPD